MSSKMTQTNSAVYHLNVLPISCNIEFEENCSDAKFIHKSCQDVWTVLRIIHCLYKCSYCVYLLYLPRLSKAGAYGCEGYTYTHFVEYEAANIYNVCVSKNVNLWNRPMLLFLLHVQWLHSALTQEVVCHSHCIILQDGNCVACLTVSQEFT